MMVVFNSSPWIILAKLGLLERSLELFDRVVIPVSVRDEVISDVGSRSSDSELRADKQYGVGSKQ